MADVVDFQNYRHRKFHNDNEDDSPLDDTGFIDDDLDEEPQEDPGAGKRRIISAIGSAAVVILVIVLIMLQSRARTFTSARFTKVTDMLSDESVQYFSLGSNIVSVSRDGASCMDTKGRQIWNITFDMQQPIVATGGDYMAIGDYDGSTIYMVSGSSSIGSVDTNMPIRGLTVAENGEVAAILNDTDVTWVYLFDSDGNTIAYFKTTLSQSGYPLAVAISPNGKIVAISHLTIGTEQVSTSISFHNFGAAGQNEVEKNVGGFNYEDEVAPYLVYMNDSTCAAVTDKRLCYFNGTESLSAGADVAFDAEVQGVYSNSRYVALVFPDDSGEAEWNIQVYDTSGNLVSTIPFSMDYTDLQLIGDRIIINNDNSLLIFNVDGTQKFSETFDDVTLRAVIPQEGSTSHLTVITDSEMDSVQLE